MASKELKTKPIQHSIRTLMSYGISPDFLVVRADTDIPENMIQKISGASGIKREYVISAPTLDSIYRVPLLFHEQDFGKKILHSLDLDGFIDIQPWKELLENIESSINVIRIGVIGKYTQLEDAYYSLNE